MSLSRRTSRLGRLFYCLISALVVLAVPARCTEPNKTVVADVIYRADGGPARGTLLISWPAFTTSDGKPIASGTLSVKIAANGSVNIPLVPTQGATPSGTAYKVILSLEDGSTSTEYWSVPSLSPTTIAAIRSTQVPATVAMQVVSREYVDAQLATAIRKNGDEVVSGTKTFVASPLVPTPGTEAAAANKGYVDVAIAAAAPSSSNVLNINKGGTGTNTFTPSRCVRVADDGNSLESAAADCGSGGTGTNADTVDGMHAADLNNATRIQGSAVAAPAAAGTQPVFDGTNIAWQSKVAVDVRDFAGADCGAKIQSAHDIALPASGGVIDARGCSGASTITGFTLTKPTRLLLCNSQWTLATTIAVRADLTVEGCNRGRTSITSAADTAIFMPSGTAVKRIDVAHLTLSGGSGVSSLVVFPDFVDGVTDFSQGMYRFEDNNISGFGAAPIQLGKSTYMVEIVGNLFMNNHGGVIAKRDSEPHVERNQFWYQASGPAVWLYGHSLAVVDHNDFEVNGSGSTDPDILFTPDASGNTGYIWITRNKFGPEGDSAARYKIRIAPAAGDDVPRRAMNVRVNDNNFNGVDGQKAVRIESPLLGFVASGNFVNTISTFLSDVQPASNAFEEGAGGGNLVFDTRVLKPTTDADPFRLCENGCRTFSRADAPLGIGSAATPLTERPRDNETAGVSNYLLYSENFAGGGWTTNGVTLASGQADPFGTTRAFLLTRAGASAFENIGQTIQSGYGNNLSCSVWAKAGTSDRFGWNLYDTTTATTLFSQPQYLDAKWRRYKMNFAGLTAGHSHRVLLYPDGFNVSTKTIYLFGAQCSDDDSDYVPTTTAKIVDPTRGNRWERQVQAAGGISTPKLMGVTDAAMVANLNSDQVDGKHATDFPLKPAADCHDATASKLLYDQASNTLACGTDQGSSGGGSYELQAWCSSTLGSANGATYTTLPFNTSTSANCGNSVSNSQEMPVSRPVTISNLTVRVGTACASAATAVKVYRNGVASSLLVNGLTDTAPHRDTNPAHNVTLAVTDTYSVMITTGQASESCANFRISYTITP